MPVAHLRCELDGAFLLTENISHEQDAVNPRFGVLLQLGLNDGDAGLRQCFNRLRREEWACDQHVRSLGNDCLWVAGDLSYILDDGGDVGVGRVLGDISHAHEPVAGDEGQRDFIVSDGSGDDPQGLGWNAHDSIQPLDFAGPAEIRRVDDSPDVFERLGCGFGGWSRNRFRSGHRETAPRSGRWRVSQLALPLLQLVPGNPTNMPLTPTQGGRLEG